MKKITTTLLLLFLVPSIRAQNIGINVNGVAPAASALLDIDASALPANAQRGLLVPRMALTATNVAAPVTAPATSLLIYNTATAGVAPNNVTPGYYYWNGAAWSRLLGTGNAWQITGNTLTGTEFMGSVNAQPVRFFSNNIERMRINSADGEVVVGAVTSGLPGDMLCAVGNVALPWAVNGYTAFNGGATYGMVRPATPTIYGAVQGEYYGVGVAGGAGTGVRGLYNGTSTLIDRAGVEGSVTTPTVNNGGVGVSGFNGIGTGNTRMGILGEYNGTAFGAGVIGVGFGGALPAGNIDFGVVGWVANAYAGTFSGYFNGNHVIANGTKAATVGTSKGNQMLYVTELPEVWFEDVGSGMLVNGEAHIELDPLFLETVFIDEAHPMHVFVQPQGECNGMFVELTTTGFTVKELMHGTSGASFSYRIMAKRLHFQDHRFGSDPLWGAGDTRKYNSYATPPPVDHAACIALRDRQRSGWKQPLMPEGFTPYSLLQRKSNIDVARPATDGGGEH